MTECSDGPSGAPAAMSDAASEPAAIEALRLDAFAATTCVVTGGLGFIGSNLATALAAGGAEVRVVDGLVAQHGGDRRNLEPSADIEVVIADLGEPAVAEVVDGADVVFNVAGQVSHHASMTEPLRDLELNVASHLRFLETLRRVNPATRLVLTSTRQVYGRPQYLPVDETHPTAPVDVNGIDKLACEQLHLLYGRVHGLRPTALRLTNVFGPRQNLLKDDLGVLPVFIRRALLGEGIELFGDGGQRRDCLFVDDVVTAMGAAAEHDAAIGEVINVGNLTSWSLREIASTIVEAAGGASTITRVPFPEHLARIDIGDFDCDISRAASLLGWKPAVSLVEAAERTVSFYRRHPWYLSPSSI